MGNAVLFSIGQAARARGSKVLYFAAYKKPQDRFKAEQIEQAADTVVGCSDAAPGITPGGRRIVRLLAISSKPCMPMGGERWATAALSWLT